MIGDALSLLLPGPDDTALLAACLRSGTAAREAWARWRSGHGGGDAGAVRALAGTRTLLPLLSRSVARNGLEVGPDLRSYLHAATLREELRADRYREIVEDLLGRLDRRGVAAVVVRGVALAATVYEGWRLRHCHDLDLLVGAEDLARASRALDGADYACVPPDRSPPADVLLRHRSGLEVAMHVQPFAVPYYAGPVDGFLRGARTIAIGGTRARAPSAEAMLVHVLGHATCSASRRNLRWVADAWHLVAATPALDWSDVLARIDAHRLALPVSVLVRHLADSGAPVPGDLPAALDRRAARADRVAQDVAIGCAHIEPRDLLALWRTTRTWRGRARIVRWMVAPSRGYLRSTFPGPSGWALPLCYLYRPARFVAASVGRRTAP